MLTKRLTPDAVEMDEWEALAELAVRHRVAPMLHWQLKQSGGDALIPPAVAETLSRAMLRAVRNFTLQEIAHRTLDERLHEAGIATIWLKGAALAHTIYPDPALRPMGDLDVLVPHDRCFAALDVLQREGYRMAALDQFRPSNHVPQPEAKTNHHYELVGGPSDAVAVELHFRLLAPNDELLPLEAQTWFWRQTQSVAFDEDRSFTSLNAEAHLLYLAAHAILQHGESEELLRFLDMHFLIERHPLDWERTAAQARVLGWSSALSEALRRTMEYFHTPVPSAVGQSLAQQADAADRGAGLRWKRARGTLAGMTLGGRMRYVMGSVFPSTAYMRRKYDVAGRRPLWRLYLHRWRDQAGDVLWALRKRRPSEHTMARGMLGSAGASPSIKYENSVSIIEQLLSDKTPVSFRAGGQSMRPVIGDGDLVRVIPLHHERMTGGAVVLYRRGDKLVLHRAIRVSDEVVTAADAGVEGEASVPLVDVIGMAETVERAGHVRRLDTRRARWFGLIWYRLRPARRAWSKLKNINRKEHEDGPEWQNHV